MQPEPQHPIESSLRDWAATRRLQAGAPFELHPVDRDRLQAEVARKLDPQARPARRSTLGWRRYLPRLALGLGTVTLLLWIFPSLLPTRNDSGIDLARNEVPVAGRELRSVMSEAPEQTPEPPSLAMTEAAAVPPADLHPRPRSVPRPEPAAAPMLQRYGLEQAIPERKPPPPSDTAIQLDIAPSPTVRPPVSVTSTGFRSVSMVQSEPAIIPTGQPPDWTVEFTRLQAPHRNPNAPPDLALRSFRLEQHGDALRLLDEDGSIYQGTFLPTPPVSAATRLAQTLADQSPPEDGAVFRVSGTNRSTQMNLVFQGVLVTGATVRVRGHATLGDRDRIVVDALSTPD